jgi:hypothetical protein
VLVRAHTNKYARRTYDALFRLLEARHASNGMRPYLHLMSKLANISLITCLFLWAIGGAQGGALVTPGESSKPMSNDQEGKIAAIKSLARGTMKEYNLKALIVQVTEEGRNLYTEAFGESMSGVPATPAMHFRNGAMAFTYISTMLLELVDQKKVTLDFSSLGNALAPETLSKPEP